MENEQQRTDLTDKQNQELDNVGQGGNSETLKQVQGDNSNSDNNDANLDNVGQNEELYGAPESYDFKTIEFPEGIEYNEEYGKKFSTVAKELNLSQKSANKLVNMYVDILKEQAASAPETIKEFNKKQIQAEVENWDKAINQDAEIGNGNKDKIEAYMAKANEGYKAFASDGLQDILKQKGLNHHPEIIKLFYKLSNLTGEDKILTGGNTVKEESPAEILYGKTRVNI